MTLTIRPFVASDQSTLIETINAVCSEGQWMSTPRFEPTPAWIRALEEPTCIGHLLLIVEDMNYVVGWCRIFRASCPSTESVASLGVGLLPAYRDQGIGTALVRWSLGWAAEAGQWRIMLTTYRDNARAIHVFTKCGFSFTGQTYNISVEMACDLPVAVDAGKISTGSVWKTPYSLSYQGESACEYVI